MPCQKCKCEDSQKVEMLGRLLEMCSPCFGKLLAPKDSSQVSEHYFTTPTEDQAKALDEAAAYGMRHPWDLISIFWTHQNDAGHHCFTINYTPKISVAPTDGMD